MARGAVRVVSINGALTVTFTAGSGATPTVFSDEACTTTTALPATVADGATNTFYFASPGAYNLSVKTASGIQIAADLNTTKVVTVDSGDVGVYAYDARLVAKDFSGDSGRHSPNTDLAGTYAPIAVSGRAAGVTAYTGQGRVQTDAGTILQAWYAELANRHYSPVDIAVVGDSITEGMGATAFDNRWIARLRDALRNRFPTTGLGNAGGRGYISFRKTGETTFTWPVTLANDPGINEDYGPKRAITGAFSNGTQTATASLTYTEFDVMWLRNAGFGVSYVTVDGGAPSTINQAGALLDGATFRVTGGGGTAHTIVFGWSSGGSLYADGFIEYNGDLNKGIRVHDCGHYGYNTGSWVAGGQGGTQWPAAVAKLGKSLILMPIGINDVNAGLTAAQTQANITTMIAAIRGGYTGGGYSYSPPPIVLIPYWSRSGEEALWPDHVAAMYAAAAADSATVVCDIFARFPSGTANTGSIYADGLHPNDKGASMVADAVLQFLTP